MSISLSTLSYNRNFSYFLASCFDAIICGVHSIRPRFVQEFIVLRWGILELLVLNLRNVAVMSVEHIYPRIPHPVGVDERIECECLVLLFWGLNQLESLLSISIGHIFSESQLLSQ